jgi:hypothetical protein
MTKSRGMKTVGHLSFVGKETLYGNLRKRDNLEDHGVNLRIVLIHIVNK